MSSIINLEAVCPRLSSSNYSIWKVKMEMMLIREGLWNIVNGKRTKPSEEDKVDAYEQDVGKAVATIFLYLGDAAARHVQDLRDPEEIWKKLKELYESPGFSTRFLLWKQLMNANQKGLSMEAYVDHIKALVRQLKDAGLKVENEIIASALLNGLDSGIYNSFIISITQLYRDKDTISIDTLCAQLLDEEKRQHLENTNGDSDPSLALQARYLSNITCHYCKKKGHKEFRCRLKQQQSQRPEVILAAREILL